MVSWRAVGIAAAVIVTGAIIATLNSSDSSPNRGSARSNGVKEVPIPMIGGASINREGPWPQCVGMDADECKRMIQTYASDVRGNVVILSEDAAVTMDFRTDRVRIFVDEKNVVTHIPGRG